MDIHHDTTQFLDATRRDGWTPELKARFLALLADNGNVRLSARRCGLSAQSAYVQRRRDPVFARGWAAALVLALHHAEQVLADRAIEGIEEEVYYRGELIATRRRYDTRLLLAHLARLDRMADEYAGGDEADRFDELLALVAGEELPEGLEPLGENEILPAPREAHADAAATRAVWIARHELDEAEEDEDEEEHEFAGPMPAEEEDDPGEVDPLVVRDAYISQASDAAWYEAVDQWDAWFDRACGVADRLAGDIPPDFTEAATSMKSGRPELVEGPFFSSGTVIEGKSSPSTGSGQTGSEDYPALRPSVRTASESNPQDSVNLSTSLPALPRNPDILR